MDNYYVYMHKNKINNKVYIGITSQKLTHRWGKDGNGYKYQKLFARAINKYGWDNFEHIILKHNITKKPHKKFPMKFIAHMSGILPDVVY